MRPIDADKLTEEYKRLLQRFEEMGDDGAITAVELCRHKAECVAPTLDVVLVVHGEWVDMSADDDICSICGKPCTSFFDGCDGIVWAREKPNYCPNCGAKMDGRKVNE